MSNTTKQSEDKTTTKNVKIKHEGSQIILPVINGKTMTFREGIEWLQRKEKEDETVTSVHHEFPCSPLDGLHAFTQALAEKFGWTQLVPTPGFFGTKNPPVMVGIPVGPNEVVQVPYGRVEVPGIDGFLETGLDDGKFILGGQVKQKNHPQVQEIAELTRKILKEQSIYKGKAIKVKFTDSDDDDFDPIQGAPQFLELAGIKDDDLIFGKRVLNDLNIGLFTPIEQTEACRQYGVPLKRGVLLYGQFGTGKTMTAYVSALKAVRHGWTFIYLDSVRDLRKGLEFAAKYSPCVLFAEDIDRVVTGNRSLKMDDILNLLDGVDTKGAEILTVFTTNHVENINPALLRMGRLDTLVEVSPPDAEAVQRLVKLYSRGLLEPTADLNKIGEVLAGQIPAFIREVTERAKIAAIARLGGVNIEGNVAEADLIAAAEAMQTHANMLKPRQEDTTTNTEVFVRMPSGLREGTRLLTALNDLAGNQPSTKSANNR